MILFSCNDQGNTKIEEDINEVETAEYDDRGQEQVNDFAIVIHGGAGTIRKENMTPELEKLYEDKLTEAIQTGHQILKNGGSAMDAVEATIRIMENSPLFNAGKGAVFNSEAMVDLDASFMDGSQTDAGAVAGTMTVKNPISLARKIMTDSKHVMLNGEGADAFAKAISDKYEQIEIVPNSYFHTENRLESLKRAIQAEKNAQNSTAYFDHFAQDNKYGTVGCVALDKNGNIAAGTSTGGMTNKKYGRIGDSPIIGAGVYANNAICGVSSTGHGEYFMRGMVAADIHAMMLYGDQSVQVAAREVVQNKLSALGGTGGVIAIDHSGNIVMEFNTPGMYRANMGDDGKVTIGMYKD
jgi:beta-aspartyl-peptidase (threonine type)